MPTSRVTVQLNLADMHMAAVLQIVLPSFPAPLRLAFTTHNTLSLHQSSFWAPSHPVPHRLYSVY